MAGAATHSSDIAFTPAVKAIQARKGSRRIYERVESKGAWQTAVTPELKKFIEEQRSVFLATASRDGQPTIQHRGGPPGFLRVVDEKTLAFVDYVGNRQYVTLGNLSENPKANLLLIDYAHRRRIKIWGTAVVVEGDEKQIAALMPEGYHARPEQVIRFTVEAWDVNCPQHIPQRFEAEDVSALLAARDKRIHRARDRTEAVEAGQSVTGSTEMTEAQKDTVLAGGTATAHARLGVGSWTIIVILVVLLGATGFVAYLGWTLGSGTDVPISGYVSMALGVVFSLAVGFGLMGLVFYSSRSGYDEAPVYIITEDGSGPKSSVDNEGEKR